MVQAVSLSSLAPAPPGANPRCSPSPYPRPEPSVLIGIFPAAVVHIRPGDTNDDGSLAVAYEKALRIAEEKSRNGIGWASEMEAVKEEDEEALSPGRTLGPVIDIPSGDKRPGIVRPNRPKSLVLDGTATTVTEMEKEQPPLPKLTAGDSTVAGQQWPLVDEIACAVREWHGVGSQSSTV